MAKKGTGETPLMRQYGKIKARHPGAILLFRMGDFYETFDDDAVTVSNVLGITLTKRSNGGAAEVPLAGFPHHALDSHLPRLVRAGLRVAICEQLEDPKLARKIVKRDVVEVVTPGVLLHDGMLDPRRSTYVVAVRRGTDRQESGRVGLGFLDASTGEFYVAEVPEARLAETLMTIGPAELLVDKKQREWLHALQLPACTVTPQEDWCYTYDFAYETLLRHFKTHSLKGFGTDEMKLGLRAAGAALYYVSETQRGQLPQVRRLQRYASEDYMALDPQTKRNLELVASMQSGEEGSLVGILDLTKTSMGARLLRKWLVRPLCRVDQIEKRLEAVAALVDERRRRETLRDELQAVGDLERLAARMATGRAAPRDLQTLRLTLAQIPAIKALLEEAGSDTLRKVGASLTLCLDAVERIGRALVDEPPATLGGGGVIRDGYSDELDELRALARSGKDWIAQMQRSEIERTGIPSLKVGFNKVFGYYLEITNAHRAKVPGDYLRKQTLVNAERYITPALKEYEEKVLSAEERIGALESELFDTLRMALAEEAPAFSQNASLLAMLDCFVSLAEVAVRYGYTRPVVDESYTLDIREGRHPVVERTLPPGEPFIPNSVDLDPDEKQILLITGPNMAGKSVVLRQTGLIVLLAQVGSFVPAAYARVGVVDRIYTRVGASDNLAAGESTFLVEMNEAANILNNATPRSLILLDEVGRGTSTFDGLSIAWALVEYLHEQPPLRARTLFATHYHELNELAARLPRLDSARVQVHEHEGKVIFLRKLVPGGADHSYGIEVARMAGLPDAVILRAREILAHLEAQHVAVGDAPSADTDPAGDGAAPTPRARRAAQPEAIPEVQMTLFTPAAPDPVLTALRDALASVDPNRLTPIEALMKLAELKRLLDG